MGFKLKIMRRYFAAAFLLSFSIFFLLNSANAKAFSFAVIGDTQKFKTGKNDALRQAAENISASGADFTFMMGDFCSGKNCAKKLSSWKKTASLLFPEIYGVHGNHDLINSSSWQSVFNPPLNGPAGYESWTYSFDYENSHFVVLDSSRSRWHLIDQTQRDWLEQDLAGNTKENIFVFFHEPAFPVSKKIGKSLDARPSDRNALWQILDNYNVTAVFSGHEHIYSRKKIDSSVFSSAENSIYQFVVGNTDSYSHSKPSRGVDFYYRPKSFLIVEVSGSQITTKLYSTNGKFVENFSYSK